MNPLAERIHAALPQTQCTRCGYPDCSAYAQAVADSDAAINQCPPGGAEGVARLAAITGRPALPLNPSNGVEAPRTVAVIDEAWCIGCTLCLPVCPTDAILGSNKRMHTVIEPHCTGCELCLAVCPVDCIRMDSVSGDRSGWQAWSPEQAGDALRRYGLHRSRLERQAQAHADAAPPDQPRSGYPGAVTAIQRSADDDAARKREAIQAAVARARARRPV